MAEAPVRRVLIYTSGDLIGDGLLKLPAVRTLRRVFPGAHLTWLAGHGPSVFAGALAPLVREHLDEVIQCAGVGVRYREWLTGPALPRDGWDVVIDTLRLPRSTLSLRHLRARVFLAPAAGFRFSRPRPRGSGALPRSLPEYLCRLFALAGGREQTPDYRLWLPAGYREAARELLPEGRAYLGLAPGSGGANKCWPLENYIELAHWAPQVGLTPAFFIGPAERAWVPRLKEAVPGALFPDLEGHQGMAPGPLLSLALGERLRCAVANDAGGGHILAAGGRPVVTLFGRSDPAKFVAPGTDREVITAASVGVAGVEEIPVAVVRQRIERVLSRR
ncbi:MAG: lipopolysaccharide heptosyltransferase family protein [Gammaproteobacteria bacterium]|nr:MAG: lipopolysaccharide heptosyltransferase family protein [Gammaproteobacteria bacterium]